MIELIRVGFFREMHHGQDDDESIADAGTAEPGPHREQLLEYLQSGHKFTNDSDTETTGHEDADGAAEAASDTTDDDQPTARPAESAVLLTDGRFVWSSELVDYVRNHDIELPSDFVDHMAAFAWRVPAHLDLRALSLPDDDVDMAEVLADLKAMWPALVAELDLDGIRQQFAGLADAVRGFFTELLAPSSPDDDDDDDDGDDDGGDDDDDDDDDGAGLDVVANALRSIADWLQDADSTDESRTTQSGRSTSEVSLVSVPMPEDSAPDNE